MMKVLPSKKPIVQQARWEKELAQVRCRCGPRRQVAIIRSPSLLYIVVTQLSLLKILYLIYILYLISYILCYILYVTLLVISDQRLLITIPKE